MNPLIIIPSRLASTRLPQKPLADIHGLPMIVHVYNRAIEANVGPVIVAAGDPEIAEVIESHGGIAILTDPDLPSGTDRIKAAMDVYDSEGKHDIIVNVQGDLPTLSPHILQDVLEPFKNNPHLSMATLGNRMIQDVDNPNDVKIALSLEEGETIGRALYFSRNVVPWGEGDIYHHIGIYAYSRACLNTFVGLPVSSLEKREKLEQLRALSHGMGIDVKIVDTEPFGVDTPEDLEKARNVLRPSA